ncbi:hypothetical protein F5887DRAFT_405062 [Amanita rubescens]|nr:hypothetical protein F5887DRAFT_405062 [Amanita rubescens]
MSSRRQSPTPRRVVPIKRADGEPLTRSDIQYDLLSDIFSDTSNAFTNPWKNSKPTCFRDLYVDAIINSPKATKALKDKMSNSPTFATSFAMLSLLVNVGRINTTMSFFPEMKTAIRTYHPIPALQKAEGNLQDAPRIKHILKASLLSEDGNMPPITPQDIVSRLSDGQRPSTSITNLLFVLASHSVAVQKYFKPTEDFPLQLDFLDLFLRSEISSPSRGRAFLWMCWKFLEKHDDDSSNPFSGLEGRAPAFALLSKEQTVLENIDPEEEKIIAEKLILARNQIVMNNSIKEAQKEAIRFPDDINQDLPSSVLDDRSKVPRGETSSTRNKAAQAAKERKAMADKLRRERIREKREQLDDAQSDGDHGLDLVDRPGDRRGYNDYRQRPGRRSDLTSRHIRNASPIPEASGHQRRYSPYKQHKQDATFLSSQLQKLQKDLPPSMTMLQHAWHMIRTTDPLVDSDDELGDDDTRLDYMQRMSILSRIRGKSPTPEPELLRQGS